MVEAGLHLTLSSINFTLALAKPFLPACLGTAPDVDSLPPRSSECVRPTGVSRRPEGHGFQLLPGHRGIHSRPEGPHYLSRAGHAQWQRPGDI